MGFRNMFKRSAHSSSDKNAKLIGYSNQCDKRFEAFRSTDDTKHPVYVGPFLRLFTYLVGLLLVPIVF